MPIVVSIDWDAVNSEQYDSVMNELNLEANPPAGLIFHVASFDDTGAHITDLWESAEDLQNYGANTLAPALAAVGVEGFPPMVVRPAHRTLIP